MHERGDLEQDTVDHQFGIHGLDLDGQGSGKFQDLRRVEDAVAPVSLDAAEYAGACCSSSVSSALIPPSRLSNTRPAPCSRMENGFSPA